MPAMIGYTVSRFAPPPAARTACTGTPVRRKPQERVSLAAQRR
jgi:hypothetical protein